MPLLGVIVLVIQVSFAYHALKSGRPYWWLFVIMGFPVMGCLLYYFIEVFPGTRGSRKVENSVRTMAKAFDSGKDLRQRIADVEICGSVGNKVALAQECVQQKMLAEAVTLIKDCLTGIYKDDAELRFALANTLLLKDDWAETKASAQWLIENHPSYRTHDVRLIYAKALEGLNELDGALREFETLSQIYPGEEGRWRYGSLLKRLGRFEAARQVFELMLRMAEHMPSHYREAQREWLSLARQSLQAQR
jgi:hypothetical protein